jgi:hypothetical protein
MANTATGRCAHSGRADEPQALAAESAPREERARALSSAPSGPWAAPRRARPHVDHGAGFTHTHITVGRCLPNSDPWFSEHFNEIIHPAIRSSPFFSAFPFARPATVYAVKKIKYSWPLPAAPSAGSWEHREQLAGSRSRLPRRACALHQPRWPARGARGFIGIFFPPQPAPRRR